MKHNAMAFRTPLTLFAGLLTVMSASRCPAQSVSGSANRPTPPAPVVVQTAISNAKAYLYSRQKPDGTWENVSAPSPVAEGGSVDGTQWGGTTALVVYSLLASGENPTEPRLAKAIDFLRGADRMAGVYAIGMRAQVWPLLPDNPENRRLILRDGRLLLEGMNRSGIGRGLYRYNIRPNGEWDHSASQIGVLGMWALSQAGYEAPNDYWQLVDAAWRANQRNGGWAYDQQKQREGDVTASMTAAGVATLFLTQDYLHAQEGLNCRGNITNRSIEDGLSWMGKNLSRADSYYALYGVERIGVASGYKYLGDTDWYTFGAQRLISRQRDDGAWAEGLGGAEANTAFGLLFLTRGRAPVLMSKLDYQIAAARGTPRPGAREANWNQRPRDAANAVRYVAKQLEKPLNWQITTLDAPVSELLDSPILYLSGNQALGFTEAEEAKIRSFLQQGGILLANADCNAPSFAQSVRALGKRLFPDYDFRELPEDHPIYTRQQFPRSAWRQKPSLLALGNEVREMILLMPSGDTARAWQTYDMAKLPQFQLLANIHLYSVDKTHARTRGDTYLISPRVGVTANRTVRLARLKYPGNWDPEPAGWDRLATHLVNTHRVQLTRETVELGKSALNPKDHPLAHLTGTQAFKLSDTELAELKSYVEGGGTLLVDAAGGREGFATSLDESLVKTFGDSLKELLPPESGIYRLGGELTPTYRAFSRGLLSGSELKSPRLRGSTGKGNVFFSREDLSAGLVGQPVDGIFGYSPESALDLASRVVLWSLGDRPPPQAATRPATK